jgi:hypothetical protein
VSSPPEPVVVVSLDDDQVTQEPDPVSDLSPPAPPVPPSSAPTSRLASVLSAPSPVGEPVGPGLTKFGSGCMHAASKATESHQARADPSTTDIRWQHRVERMRQQSRRIANPPGFWRQISHRAFPDWTGCPKTRTQRRGPAAHESGPAKQHQITRSMRSLAGGLGRFLVDAAWRHPMSRPPRCPDMLACRARPHPPGAQGRTKGRVVWNVEVELQHVE